MLHLIGFLLESDIEEANDANRADPNDDEDINIKLWTTSLGFA